jgi:hypothetical protein
MSDLLVLNGLQKILLRYLVIKAETCISVRALPTRTLPIESISRRLYHKKLFSPMHIFYYGFFLIYLSDLLLPLY